MCVCVCVCITETIKNIQFSILMLSLQNHQDYKDARTCLEVQWVRIPLPMQGTGSVPGLGGFPVLQSS